MNLIKKVISLLVGGLLVSLPTVLFAQISVVVVDSMNLEPIPFVAVKTDGQEFSSDEKGFFRLKRGVSILTLGALGYQTKTVSLKSREKIDTIRLQNIPLYLKEITISAKKKQEKKIGYGNYKGRVGYGSEVKSLQIAMYFPDSLIKDSINFIQKIQIPLTSNQNAVCYLKVALFSSNSENLPDQPLHENLLVEIKPKTQELVLDLEKPILFPKNAVFVIIEWLGKSLTGEDFSNLAYIKYTQKLNHCFMYVKSVTETTWIKMSQWQMRNEKPINLKINLVLCD